MVSLKCFSRSDGSTTIRFLVVDSYRSVRPPDCLKMPNCDNFPTTVYSNLTRMTDYVFTLAFNTFLLQYGSTPLHQAAVNGHTECVATLIEGGADVNFQDEVSCLLLFFI